MDRQKIFWVVLSVSVFVVVVLVVGVLLLRQRPAGVASAPGAVSSFSDTGTGIYEYQREPSAPSQTGAGQSGNQETMHFYIGEGEATGQPAPSGASAAPAAAPPTAGSAAGSASAPPAQPAQPRATPSARPSTAKPSTQARTPQKVIEYWIQTGSYKSQPMAEQLAALLGGKGLSGRVFSLTSHNETFYRVRIGPYANKGDAEKFLAIVKQVQGLESSYISQVPTTKSSVN
ncbi:MAG: SPOR domain-containing protein [Spirochaetia bacterium]|jgi:cell division protein FtsN